MFKIKSDDQRQKTVKQIEALDRQIEKVRREKGLEAAELFAKSIRHHISDLRGQVKAFDTLKTGDLQPLGNCHLSDVGPYLIKARIAAGLTQADLAKKLGVSQPMIHKYERDEYQGATAGILAKVASLLGVSINLDTFRKPGRKDYDPRRQEAVILYFVQQINNKFLGKTKLMKLLYYTDYEWIRKTGTSVIGDTYVAMPYGPVPKHAEETLKRLQKGCALRIEQTKLGDYDQERYLALKDCDLSILTREEVDHLNEIARRFAFWTATQMSDLTHEDWPWLSTELGHEIGLI
jgi:transcriptional regulator with XRE-family HTH domain